MRPDSRADRVRSSEPKCRKHRMQSGETSSGISANGSATKILRLLMAAFGSGKIQPTKTSNKRPLPLFPRIHFHEISSKNWEIGRLVQVSATGTKRRLLRCTATPLH